MFNTHFKPYELNLFVKIQTAYLNPGNLSLDENGFFTNPQVFIQYAGNFSINHWS